MRKIAIGISGASGGVLGLRLIAELCKNCEVYAVISGGAKSVLKLENDLNLDDLILKFRSKNIKFLDDSDLGACVSSGSFGIDATIIAPCSINTLAKISNGISDTLITRMSAVALKEHKRLVLGVREMPFSAISLKQMSELAALGVVIAPPVLGFYSDIKDIDDIENFIVGKWLDALDVKNKIYKRWSH